MRVNVYAEEMTDRVELVEKQGFLGLRFYTELPISDGKVLHQGPFIHREGDDDSAAVTFWGKRSMIPLLKRSLSLLEAHYDAKLVQGREANYEKLAIPKRERHNFEDGTICTKCRVYKSSVQDGFATEHCAGDSIAAG